MATDRVTLYFCVYALFLKTLSRVSADPCLDGNHMILGNLAKRSPNFEQDDAPICDRYLKEGWYKAPNYEMVASPPSLAYCGTLYPYWLNGTPPVTIETTEIVESCQVGFASNCQQSEFLSVRNCGTFNVYLLKPLSLCNAAYCFEKSSNCVEDVSKNIRVLYHNVVYTENDTPVVTQYDPVVNLKCDFTPLDDQTLFYQIDWYVDSSNVFVQTVKANSLSDATLSTKILSDLKMKLGISIHCVVGAKKSETDTPCATASSPVFFAGIEVLTPTLSLERKGTEKIAIRPTIPFATETIYDKNANKYYVGDLDITISFPNQISGKCAAGSPNLCKITFKGISYDQRHLFDDKSWYKTYEMVIQNTDSVGFNNKETRMVLRMKSSKGGVNAADIFNDVTLPDININIVEKLTVWKGKRCHSHADPHMRTFDGYDYECQHTGCVTGITSILYENKEQLQQVQVRHHKCFNPNARCICAIAVRSGKDVFLFDACNGRQYINFPICDDKSLKVVKVTDKSYKIFFPTGTYVTTTLNMWGDWFLETEIYPSVADVNKSGGLCGLLDNNIRNDLTRRTGIVDNTDHFNYYNPPDEFSKSWRADVGEDLFSHTMDFASLESLSASKLKFCACDNGVTDCSYKQFADCEAISSGKEYACLLHSSHSRRKRHAMYLASFSPDPIEYDLPIRRRRQATFITSNATSICNTAFDTSSAYTICKDNVADFSNDSVQNCILDVSLTGDPSLVSIHLESAIDQCKAFINLNETLQEEAPEVAMEITSICQNNCSYQGLCNNGTCICNEGFGGSDCAFDVRKPPNITEVLGGERCDKSKDTCSAFTFIGYYFVEFMNSTCYIISNNISVDGEIKNSMLYREQLQEHTLYEASCQIPFKTGNSWINHFMFNISNDGVLFSETFSMIVYNSECQIPESKSESTKFSLREGYCYINGQCVMNSMISSTNVCAICDVDRNKFEWSSNEDCVSTTPSTSDSKTSSSMSSETTREITTGTRTTEIEITTTTSTIHTTQQDSTTQHITHTPTSISPTLNHSTTSKLTTLKTSLPTDYVSKDTTTISSTITSNLPLTTETRNSSSSISNDESLKLTLTVVILIVLTVVVLSVLGILVIMKVTIWNKSKDAKSTNNHMNSNRISKQQRPEENGMQAKRMR